MRIRKKTITFKYRHFDVGEKVVFQDYMRKVYGRAYGDDYIYTVKKFTPPKHSCFNSTIVLKEMSDKVFQDCDLSPVSKSRIAEILGKPTAAGVSR